MVPAKYTATRDYEIIDKQLYRKPDPESGFPDARLVLQEHEVYDVIVDTHVTQLSHAGRDKTFDDIKLRYYDINKKEVGWLLNHCGNCAKRKAGKSVAPLTPITAEDLFERIQIDLIDYRHLEQEYLWCLHIRDHFSKFSVAYPLANKESETVAFHLGLYFSIFGPPGVLQCTIGIP